MDKLLIHGGRKLEGTVRVSGAKNAALPCMAATILAKGTCTLHNIPQVADVRTMGKLLAHIGIEVQEILRPNGLRMTVFDGHSKIHALEAPYDIVKTMRASSLILGPMLTRFGKARVSLPGGCAIGARPLNLHLKALESMGAKITLEEGYINAECKKLHGAVINFDGITVTGTENIMMAAVLAKGTTVIENSAREPEVLDLANFLIKMGAKISGAGTDKIIIEGVSELHATEHTIIPDRIEAGTFACAAAITGGNVTIEGCQAEFIEALLGKLNEAGCDIAHGKSPACTSRSKDLRYINSPNPPFSKRGDGGFTVQAPYKLTATNITTSPYPGFATDLQAQMVACMAIAQGASIITETIFENRFMHVQELIRLGADIKIEGHTAIVKGVPKLIGAEVMATDLRASASLILAALAAEGTTEIQRIYHLDRGYEHIEEKLCKLGAEIERIN